MSEKREDPPAQQEASSRASQSVYYVFRSAHPWGLLLSTVKAELQGGACSCRQEDRAWGRSPPVTAKLPSAEEYTGLARGARGPAVTEGLSEPPSQSVWLETKDNPFDSKLECNGLLKYLSR